jgi:LmbE family N-acetylglucosaminyl deacetylase
MSVLHTILGAHTIRHIGPVLGSIGAVGSSRLLRRAQRIFHRMPVELVDVERGRVLVVAPHMDDEVIGPGGTVLRHVRAGSDVAVVFASDGSGGTTGTERDEYVSVRKSEAERAARQMGTTVAAFLDFPDGDLCRHEGELADELAVLIEELDPTDVFVPFPTDHHRDHQATAAASAQAMKRAHWRGTVWAYEAWSPLWPNASVDISDVVDDKVAALECHASQVVAVNYVDATVGLNRFRGLRVGTPVAEAFYRAPAADFSRMCARLTGRI